MALNTKDSKWILLTLGETVALMCGAIYSGTSANLVLC